MAPDAEDCAEGTLDHSHQGRRILAEELPPAEAWTENEELERFVVPESCTSIPGEDRRFLKLPRNSNLQTGLTLGVHGTLGHKKPLPRARIPRTGKPKVKTKFQKRKDRLVELLRPPYFILTMIVLIVCIHIWSDGGLLPLLEWSPGSWRHQPWRLLTYGMVHASTGHLALNALVAIAVGWCIEREQGWARAAAVWWGGVAGGALGAAALQPRVRVVGASAAVYAMLTAHLPNICLRFGHVPLWWFRPLSVVVLAASEVLWTLLRGAVEPPVPLGPAAVMGAPWAAAAHRSRLAHLDHEQDHVAWSAHALGALVGVPFGFVLFSGENSSKRWIIIWRLASGVLLSAGALSTLLYYVYSLIENDN